MQQSVTSAFSGSNHLLFTLIIMIDITFGSIFLVQKIHLCCKIDINIFSFCSLCENKTSHYSYTLMYSLIFNLYWCWRQKNTLGRRERDQDHMFYSKENLDQLIFGLKYFFFSLPLFYPWTLYHLHMYVVLQRVFLFLIQSPPKILSVGYGI